MPSRMERDPLYAAGGASDAEVAAAVSAATAPLETALADVEASVAAESAERSTAIESAISDLEVRIPDTLPLIAGRPFTGYYAAGHSGQVGTGATNSRSSAAKVASALRVTLTNLGVGGAIAHAPNVAGAFSPQLATYNGGGWATIAQDLDAAVDKAQGNMPFTPQPGATTALIGDFLYGFNAAIYAGQNGALNAEVMAIKTIASRFFSGFVKEDENFNTFGGTGWAAVTAQTASASGTRYSRCGNSGYLEVSLQTTSGMFPRPGNVIAFGGLSAAGDVGTITFRNMTRGEDMGTFDLSIAAPAQTGIVSPWVKRFTVDDDPITPYAGETIRLTPSGLGSGDFMNVDYWQIESSVPQIAFIGGAWRPSDNNAYGFGSVGARDQWIANFNTAIEAMCDELTIPGRRVVYVDLDSILDADPANFYIDNLHPGELGHSKVAAAKWAALHNRPVVDADVEMMRGL